MMLDLNGEVGYGIEQVDLNNQVKLTIISISKSIYSIQICMDVQQLNFDGKNKELKSRKSIIEKFY